MSYRYERRVCVLLKIFIWIIVRMISGVVHVFAKVFLLDDAKGYAGTLILVALDILIALLIYTVFRIADFKHPFIWTILTSSELWYAGYEVVKTLMKIGKRIWK